MTVMRLSAILLVASVLPASDTPRTRFLQLKNDARAAASAGDFRTAAAKYQILLEMTSEIALSVYELHAEVVTPLAQIYRATEQTDKLVELYVSRVERSRPGLERGLAEADLGFYYQSGETSVERFRGEEMVGRALASFAGCGSAAAGHCRKRLFDTAGLQGAVFFQQGKYQLAEPLFRQVLGAAEADVQPEVLLVSMHAMRGILVLRKDFEEARALELKAALLEAKNPAALARLRGGSDERSRAR